MSDVPGGPKAHGAGEEKAWPPPIGGHPSSPSLPPFDPNAPVTPPGARGPVFGYQAPVAPTPPPPRPDLQAAQHLHRAYELRRTEQEARQRGRGRGFAVLSALVVVALVGVAIWAFLAGSGDADGGNDGAAASGVEDARTESLRELGLRVFAGNSSVIKESDESSMSLNINGYNSGGYDQMERLLDELGCPMTVEAQIGITRALDGMQTATCGNHELMWTYHPDHGIDLIVGRNSTE